MVLDRLKDTVRNVLTCWWGILVGKLVNYVGPRDSLRSRSLGLPQGRHAIHLLLIMIIAIDNNDNH